MEDRCVSVWVEAACKGDTVAKVAEYERFVEERLKVDLQAAMEDGCVCYTETAYNGDMGAKVREHKVQEEIQVFEELVRNIEALEANGVEEMRAMVNLGGEVFVQADVPDTSHIFVSVGLGFHVEFTRLEAKEFAASKIEHLRKQVARHTERISSIKAHIKLVSIALGGAAYGTQTGLGGVVTVGSIKKSRVHGIIH
ncbi:unnamed protein product [Closterium sp. Naga37s-1]|nr:unnamed protein product [Closterium sp. Naga37s-1]